MIETRTSQYEGMFLLSQAAAADFAGAVQHVRDLLGKSEAEVIAMSKWDERRFAFEIKRQKRGIYLLSYFSCKTDKVVEIERSCHLSETVLRSMITSAEHLTIEEMKSTDAQQALADEAVFRKQEAEARAAAPTQAPAPAQEAPAEAPAETPSEPTAEAPADAEAPAS